MEEKDGKTFTKKDLKLQIQERKLEEKARKAQEKAEIKVEKERIRNSFGRKVKNFFSTIIFVIILVIIAFFVCKELLARKERDLSNERMKQVYQTAIQLLDDKDYGEALKLFNSLTKEFENYSEVPKKIKEVEQLYLNEYLVDADKYLKEKRYDRALDVLNKIEQSLKNSELVISKKSEINIAKITDEVETLEKENNVLEILRYLKLYNDDNLIDVSDKIDELIVKYKNDFILETRDLMNKDLEAAEEKIKKIQEIMPDDEDVKKLVEEFTQKEPVSLLSLKETSQTGRLSIVDENDNSKIEDIDGTTFKNYIVTLLFSQENNSITYDLDKQYSTFKGKIGISKIQGNKTLTNDPKVNIYGDDKILYTSDNLNYNTKTKEFSVDVSKVKELKIEIVSDYNIEIFVAEPMLLK